ncbi:MAG TPA: aminotransferase class III-fold pyridoxal phosphate-dependent enzyme, partial [Candidatus Kryptobacter bacterium]|nr:aminotransferase class III-fold pyridoxal phosphate-dependent enzyme [Candidatus Kryptobacter bacterium]
ALGATSCTSEIYDGFLSDDKRKSFFHGHSYTGNPVACAAALASLDLLEKSETWDNIKRIVDRHWAFLSRIKSHPRVKNPRQVGTVVAFDVATDEEPGYLNKLRDWMNDYCVSRRIIIRPLGNVIYLIPPYCITDEELDMVYQTLSSMLDEIPWK